MKYFLLPDLRIKKQNTNQIDEDTLVRVSLEIGHLLLLLYLRLPDSMSCACHRDTKLQLCKILRVVKVPGNS